MLQSVSSHSKYLSFVQIVRYLLPTRLVQSKFLNTLTRCLLLTLVGGHVLGCLKTVVSIPEEDKNVARLIQTANHPVICHYSSNTQTPEINSEGTRGHQYFMGVIPFGSISTPSGADLIAHYLRQQGGILGIRCEEESNSMRSPLLLLSVDEITLSGYDFIFFRKPSSSLIVRADLYESENGALTLKRSCRANSDEYELRQYAFSKELARVFDAAWRKVMNDLLTCILNREK